MKETIFLILFIFSNLIYGQIPNELSNEEKIYGLSGYIGVTVPLISVKQCHFERSYNYIKN
jgi:hypothetical protein